MAATTLPDIEPHRASPGLTVEFTVNEAQFGDGYEQVSREGINREKEKWSLTWTNEDKADVDTLVAFFQARGGDEPFFWKAPTDVAAKLWRVRGFNVSPQSTVSSTLTAEFKRWFGEEP